MDQPPTAPTLPPLNALRTFEVAGRLQSIRKAALELVVTPGAVSRQVHVLESWLGIPLFVHEPRAVRLTAAGSEYLAAVSEHLDGIAAATERLTRPRRDDADLSILANAMFSHWLIPRLPTFHRGYPWINLELTVSSRPGDFGQRAVDAEIHRGQETLPGYRGELLLSDPMVCVCSPAYRDSHRLRAPDDLRGLDRQGFLRSMAAPALWDEWLAGLGLRDVECGQGPVYGDSALAHRAALSGQGVMLLPATLVESDLAAGRLVAPFADFPVASTTTADFHLLCPTDKLDRKAFLAFRKWVVAELSRSSPDAKVGVA